MKTIKIAIFTIVLFNSISVHAGFEEGKATFKQGDYVTTLKEFKQLAEAGHAKAQTNLGYMYQVGKGVPQDEKMAVAWYRKASDQGLAN